MNESLPDFDLIADILSTQGADTEPAESHGVLCALFCTVQELDNDTWLALVLTGPSRDALAPVPEPLASLFDETRRQFDSEQFDFHLLLPHDDANLAVRVEALGHWCQGFLTGLAAGGIQQPENLPG